MPRGWMRVHLPEFQESEKHTLLDAAKLSYVKKVEEGTSAQPTLAPTISEVSPEAPLVQGWALRGAKKTVRFNDNQRKYLHDKFEIGQESGHKADPEHRAECRETSARNNDPRRPNKKENGRILATGYMFCVRAYNQASKKFEYGFCR